MQKGNRTGLGCDTISSSAGRQKGLTGYCFKYIERPFCLQTDVMFCKWNKSLKLQECQKKLIMLEFEFEFVSCMPIIFSVFLQITRSDIRPHASCCQPGDCRCLVNIPQGFVGMYGFYYRRISDTKCTVMI